MRYSLLAVVPWFLASFADSAVVDRDNRFFQPKICPHLHVKEGGCIRCNSFATISMGD